MWALFPQDTKYFDPAANSFMINYRVDDLAGLLKGLEAEGVHVEARQDEYGHFAWVIDPEGHRIELWEPAKG